MNELEDKKLSEHIRSVFEEFEDEGAAAGWQQLRRSYPSRNRRPLILWLSSAAAVMVLLCGLWLWKGSVSVGEDQDKAEYADVQKPSDQSNSSQTGDALKAGSPDRSDKVQAAEQFTARVPLKNRVAEGGQELRSEYRTATAGNTSFISVDASAKAGGSVAQAAPPARAAGSREIEGSELRSDRTFYQSLVSVPAPSPPTNTDKELPENPYGQERIAGQTLKPALNEVNIETPINTEKASEKKVSFAVVGGSYFNFAEGSDASLNFSAGLASDIRLTRNLKLSTGLSLASNNLYYEQGVPSPENLDYFSAPVYSGTPGSNNLVNTAAEYSAQLLNLDIPLNLKYMTGKNGFFISGGLSSGLYLSESYTMGYRTFDLYNGSYQTGRKADKVRETFSGVDIAKTLNISFGRNFPFGKKQTISIEPFLKYPLQGLGAQDLRFGASGVHLRLNFNSSKP